MLTGVHYIYMLFILIVLLTMSLKRDTLIPCIIGIFCIALYASNDIVFSVGGLYLTHS